MKLRCRYLMIIKSKRTLGKRPTQPYPEVRRDVSQNVSPGFHALIILLRLETGRPTLQADRSTLHAYFKSLHYSLDEGHAGKWVSIGLPAFTCAPLTFYQDSKKAKSRKMPTVKQVEKAGFYLEQCFNIAEKQNFYSDSTYSGFCKWNWYEMKSRKNRFDFSTCVI